MGVRGRGGSLHVVNGEPVDHQVVVADEDSLELADEVLERVALLGAVVAVGAGEVVTVAARLLGGCGGERRDVWEGSGGNGTARLLGGCGGERRDVWEGSGGNGTARL